MAFIHSLSCHVHSLQILFRVSLALLKLYEAKLLAKDNAGELRHAMKESTLNTFSSRQLLDTAFNKIGSLPKARLNKIRKKQQARSGGLYAVGDLFLT